MVVAYIFVLYLLVHLYMATLGHSVVAHTKAMIVGYEEEEEHAHVSANDGEDDGEEKQA